jgi:hypothetical protein
VRRAAGTGTGELTGLTGFFADVIDTLGELGVGFLTLIETVPAGAQRDRAAVGRGSWPSRAG